MTNVDSVTGVIEGYVAIWGDPENRDSYGTYFDREFPPEMGLDFAPWPLHYEHAQDGVVRKEIIGKIHEVWFDEIGIRFRAKLDRSSLFFQRMASEVQEKKLATSSGTGGYAAEFDEDGRFVNWTLFEVSLTKYPSESRMPKVEMIRSDKPGRDAAGGTGVDQLSESEYRMPNIAEIIDSISELIPDEATLEDILEILASEYSPDEILAYAEQGATPDDESRSTGEHEMPENETNAPAAPAAPIDMNALADLIATRMAAQQPAPAAPAPTPAPADDEPSAELVEIRGQMEAMRAQMAAMQGEPPADDESETRHARPPQISNVVNLRYAHLSAADMAMGYELLRSKREKPSEEFVRHMTGKVADRIEKRSDFKFDDDYYTIRASLPETRANELMASTISGQGDEWVGVFYSSQLWEKIRISNIMERLTGAGMMVLEVPQGSESIVIPTEGSDPTWYKAQKTLDVDATERPDVSVNESQAGTSNQTLTPGTAKARILVEDELIEDSLIPVMPHLRSRLEISAADTFEYLFLNGDTVVTASTNINLIDGTPTSTGIAQPVYLVANGALKNALTTSGKNRSASGSLADTDFLNTIGLLGKQVRANRRLLLFVVDVDTEMAALALSSVKTSDMGIGTLVNGGLDALWRVPLYVSGQMDLAQAADGKISATPGNNTTGRILTIAPRYWATGWKRRVMLETDKDISAGAWTIVASMRVGFQKFSTDASAVTYNVGV